MITLSLIRHRFTEDLCLFDSSSAEPLFHKSSGECPVRPSPSPLCGSNYSSHPCLVRNLPPSSERIIWLRRAHSFSAQKKICHFFLHHSSLKPTLAQQQTAASSPFQHLSPHMSSSENEHQSIFLQKVLLM